MDKALYDWADQATAALGLPETARWVGDRDTVTWALDLAKEIAHGAVRPAAPVATFLAGVAIGLAGADDPKARERASARLLSTLPASENGS
jgi:Domain of unknown function (DUF6457)